MAKLFNPCRMQNHKKRPKINLLPKRENNQALRHTTGKSFIFTEDPPSSPKQNQVNMPEADRKRDLPSFQALRTRKQRLSRP